MLLIALLAGWILLAPPLVVGGLFCAARIFARRVEPIEAAVVSFAETFLGASDAAS